ncbi:MAG: hypothetical protein RLZZ241_1722 [Bacteroidota bacterium]|jgi:predicted PurR-regulated permease PerM
MKTILIVLGYVLAILAVVFSMTPLFKIAILTGTGALVLGLAVYVLDKKSGQALSRSLKVLFLLTLLALAVSAYKTWFVPVEVGNTEDLIEMEDQSEQEAIEELEDLDIEEFEDLDEVEVDEIEIDE